MKIVCISDTHTHHEKAHIPEGDLLIHAGDISNGKDRQVIRFLEWFEQHPHPYKVFIGGNMDYTLEHDADRYRKLLSDYTYYLENEEVIIEGLKIWGSPVVPEFVGVFNYRRGEAMRFFWKRIPDDVDLLLTHTPPKGILDRTSSGTEVGCADLRKRVDEIQPPFHIFGHVHESYGIFRTEHTTFVNASFSSSKIFRYNAPITLDW
jgi:Icc-related predicted phosphoesterase